MWHMKYHVIVFTCFMILLTSGRIFEKPHPLGSPVSSFQARIWSSSKFQLATSTGQTTPQSPSWFKIHQLNSQALVMVFPCLSAFYCFGMIHWYDKFIRVCPKKILNYPWLIIIFPNISPIFDGPFTFWWLHNFSEVFHEASHHFWWLND